MGCLRLLLALAVIVAHVGPLAGMRFFGGGVMAVQSFFIVSGFYMAMVLTERYGTQYRAFYFNRCCRLFPIYWMLLLVYLLCALLYGITTGRWLGALSTWMINDNPWFDLWALFSNITMLGCDWAELYAAIFPSERPGVNSLVFLQPAWSLSIELLFYALAPALLALPKLSQIILFVLAILLRLSIWEASEQQWSVWLYFFAPASWVFFLGGVLSYHLLVLMRTFDFFRRSAATVGWLAALLFTAAIPWYADYFSSDCEWLFYVLVALGLPWIFSASSKNRFDNWIAEWSYPLYLAHWVILGLYAPFRYFVPEYLKIYLVLAATCGLVTILLSIDRRIQARFKRPVSTKVCNQ